MSGKKPRLQAVIALLDECLNKLKKHPQSGTGSISSFENVIKQLKRDIEQYKITQGSFEYDDEPEWDDEDDEDNK